MVILARPIIAKWCYPSKNWAHCHELSPITLLILHILGGNSKWTPKRKSILQLSLHPSLRTRSNSSTWFIFHWLEGLWQLIHKDLILIKWKSGEGFLIYTTIVGRTLLQLLFSLFSMTPLGNAKNVILSSCRLLVNMTNGLKLPYYQGNTKT